jgi:hypothetical protein
MNYTVKQSIIATNCINNVEYVSYINSNILYSLNVRLISLVLLSFFFSLKIFKQRFKCLYTISTSYSRLLYFIENCFFPSLKKMYMKQFSFQIYPLFQNC